MPRFSPSSYYSAHSPDEALELLVRHGDRARIIGGNTFLNEAAKLGLLSDVEAIIDIRPLGLRHINRIGENEVAIGASVTLAEIADSRFLRSSRGLVALTTAAHVLPLQVRNVATLAGCISTGLPFLDVPTALFALDATVRLYTDNGELDLPIEDYHRKVFDDFMKDKFVKELRIKMDDNSASSFEKFILTATDYAIANIAVNVVNDKDGECKDLAIAAGGRGIELSRLRGAEASALGKHLDESTLQKISDDASSNAVVSSSDSANGTEKYRRKLVKVLVNRCLVSALSEGVA